MTRENLIKAIYDSHDRWSCAEPTSCSLVEEGKYEEVCMKCAERMLDRYEQEIRAKVLDELKEQIDDEYLDGDYGDYHEVLMIVRMIEELKEQK